MSNHKTPIFIDQELVEDSIAEEPFVGMSARGFVLKKNDLMASVETSLDQYADEFWKLVQESGYPRLEATTILQSAAKRNLKEGN